MANALQKFRQHLSEAGRSRDMVKRVIVSLGAILATAMEGGLLARNIVHEQGRGRSKRESRVAGRHKARLEVGVDIPTKDKIRAMLVAADGLHRPLIVTALFTGLRASELRGLTRNDVDLDAGATDCATARRPLEFDREPEIRIQQARRAAGSNCRQHAQGVEASLSEGYLVFPTGNGNVENISNIHRRTLGPLQVAAGITSVAGIRRQQPELTERATARIAARHPKYGLHSFRHAATSLFIEQGLSPKRVQTLLGHSSIQVTLDTYGHLFPSPAEDKAMLRQLQARLIGSSS